MRKQPDISIIIPALREEKRIGKTLDELSRLLKGLPLLCEVIVVVAEGGDNTAGVIQKKAPKFQDIQIIEPGKPAGKGRDVREGMLAARGRAVLFMDADLATPLKYIEVFYKNFQEGYDVVIGTRNLRKHHKHPVRLAVSNAGNILFRLLSGVSTEDSQCGFKLFSYRATKECFSRQTIMKWGFDMEILAIARYRNFVIRQIRINDWRHAEGGSFEDSPLRNSIDSLVDLVKIFKNRLLGRYS